MDNAEPLSYQKHVPRGLGWLSDWRRTLAFVVLVTSMIAFVVSGRPGAESGGPDIGSLMLGTPDEFELARGVHGMFENHTLDTRIPEYGGVYPMTAYAILKPILAQTGYSEWNLALGLRWYSLLFGALALACVFWLAWIVSESWAAASIATLFMATTPEVMFWAVRIHPDTLLWCELAIMLGTFSLALRRRSQRLLGLTVALTAAVTMTKLIGLYLLPWLVVAQVYLDLTSEHARGVRFRRLIGHFVKGALIFVAVVYVTTPTILVDSTFFDTLKATRKVMASGVQTSAAPTFGWFEILFDERVGATLGSVCFFVLCLSFLPWAFRLVRDPKRAVLELESASLRALAPTIFCVGYFCHLLLSIRDYQYRYAAPLLPVIAVSVGLAATATWPHLVRLQAWLASRPPAARLAPALVCAGLFIFELSGRTAHTINDFSRLATRASDPRLEVGKWLKENARPEDSIIFDYNVYVPITFKNSTVTYCLTESQVTFNRPAYVVMLDARRQRFVEGPDKGDPRFSECVRTLLALEKNELQTLKKHKRFEEAKITVYRNSSLAAPGG